MVEKLEREGTNWEKKDDGWMTVRTAREQNNPPPREKRRRIKITVSLGSGTYHYTAWFTIFPIDRYDVVLGKRWMQQINDRYHINHLENIIWIWGSKEERLLGTDPMKIVGLRPGESPRKEDRDNLRTLALAEGVDIFWMNEVIGGEDLGKRAEDGGNPFEQVLGGDSLDEGAKEGGNPLGRVTAVKKKGELRGLEEAVICYVRLAIGNTAGFEEADDEEGAEEEEIEEEDPFIREFSDLFVPLGPPPSHREKFRIITPPDAPTPYRTPYRLSKTEESELERQIGKAISKGWITPSNSAYGAPVLFIPKKDGSLRMCIDYRPLNAITVKDRYPLPLIEDLIDKLQGAEIYTKLDLSSGYHQMQVAEEDRHKTAFVTKLGLYEWKVLPFGLANGPSGFMRMMNRIFDRRPEIRKYAVVYIDDVLIFSKNEEKHEHQVRSVLQLFREEDLKLNKDKCLFRKEALEFVGFWVDKEGVHTEPQKVNAVTNWPTPKSGKEVLGFLGLSGFYRKFIEKYAHIALPLHKISHTKAKGEDFKKLWNENCEKAFKDLKNRLISSPVLAIPTPGGEWIIRSDASKEALGAVLLQRQTGNRGLEERVIGFWSRKLTNPETRYPYKRRDHTLEILPARQQIHSLYRPRSTPKNTLIKDLINKTDNVSGGTSELRLSS